MSESEKNQQWGWVPPLPSAQFELAHSQKHRAEGRGRGEGRLKEVKHGLKDHGSKCFFSSNPHPALSLPLRKIR